MSSVQEPAVQPRGAAATATPACDLLVIIVNWNVKEMLANCLRSLAAATEGLSVRSVVVDNASSDGSAAMVREQFPWVELIANPENSGFAKANNLVLRQYQGRSRYYLLLNPDTEVNRDSFRAVLDFMDAHPDAGMAGCKVVKPDGTLDWPCRRALLTPGALLYRALGLDRLFPQSRRFGKFYFSYLDPDQEHEVDSVVGAFLLVREPCLAQIGLLDDDVFFMYGEDIDWCYRAREAGWKVYYVPAASIVHHKGQSSRRSSTRMIRCWYSAIWHVFERHSAPRYSWLTVMLVRAGLQFSFALSVAANTLRLNQGVPSRR